MPKIRRENIPPRLFQHLLQRIRTRRISSDQLEELAAWLDTEPEVPEEEWYKELSKMTICGEGEFVKTFLLPGQAAKGNKLP